jgi:hypothetical protein
MDNSQLPPPPPLRLRRGGQGGEAGETIMKMHIQVLTIVAFLFPLLSGHALSVADAPDLPRGAGERIMKGNALGGAFYENRGQIVDTEGKPRPEILYYAQYRGARVYFSPTGWTMVYSVIEDEAEGVSEATGATQGTTRDPAARYFETFDDMLGDTRRVRSYRMDMTLAGCNSDVEIEATGLQQRYLNYYLPHCPDGIERVPAWSGLRYRNIYDNIDLVLYAASEGLKYEFIVHPGGRVEDIRMRHDGQTQLALGDDGALRQYWPRGYTEGSRPYAFQDNMRKVESRYVIDGADAGFAVSGHDAARTLTIDPWSTYYGGSESDAVNSLTCDSVSAVIAAGSTRSSDFPVHHAWQDTLAGSKNAFLLKFDSTGILEWATFFGGSEIDVASSVTVDAGRNILIAGGTFSADFPVHDAYQGRKSNTDPRVADGLIAKFDSSGLRIWATYFGGVGGTGVEAIGCDSAGNIYAAGMTKSRYLPVLNAWQPALDLKVEVFYLKMSPRGSLLFCSYFGGFGDDWVHSITVDKRGNFALCGHTESTNFPRVSARQMLYPGGRHTGWVASFTSNGIPRFSTYHGGSAGGGYLGGGTVARAIAFAPQGRIIVAGNTNSSDFPGLPAEQQIQRDSGGVFISCFGPTGVLLWSTVYSGRVEPSDMVTDSSGAIFIAGGTFSATDPMLNAVHPQWPGGNRNGVVAAFNPSGVLRWASYLGGSGSDGISAIAIDARGYLYLGGGTTSPDFPVFNAWQDTLAGPVKNNSDTNPYIYNTAAFITRFTVDGRIPVTLSRLAAQRVHGGVRLDWRSESEVNAHGYIIERWHEYNMGGESRWSDVGFVPAAAQGGEGRDYSWLDSNAPGGEARIFYRLRMLDNDGSFEHSPAVEVAPGQIASIVSFEAVWPAPANDWLTLRFALPSEQYVTLIVHDLSGREVARIHNNQLLGPGTHSIVIPVTTWRSGAYLCTLSTGEAHITRRVMIMR